MVEPTHLPLRARDGQAGFEEFYFSVDHLLDTLQALRLNG